MTALEMFIKAAEKFVAKVERGDARSRETYADLKAALDQAEKEANEVVEQPAGIHIIREGLRHRLHQCPLALKYIMVPKDWVEKICESKLQ